MYKGLLDREILRSEGGVKYFKDTLRPTSSKELWVFSSGDFSIYSCKERKHGDDPVDSNFSILVKRVKDSWMDKRSMSETTTEAQSVSC